MSDRERCVHQCSPDSKFHYSIHLTSMAQLNKTSQLIDDYVGISRDFALIRVILYFQGFKSAIIYTCIIFISKRFTTFDLITILT